MTSAEISNAIEHKENLKSLAQEILNAAEIGDSDFIRETIPKIDEENSKLELLKYKEIKRILPKLLQNYNDSIRIASVAHNKQEHARQFTFVIPNSVNVGVGDTVLCDTCNGDVIGYIRKVAIINKSAFDIISTNNKPLKQIIGKVTLFEEGE